MNRMLKPIPKKSSFHSKTKNGSNNAKIKAGIKKNNLHNFIHPDYILFDWEFFSRELEFE